LTCVNSFEKLNRYNSLFYYFKTHTYVLDFWYSDSLKVNMSRGFESRLTIITSSEIPNNSEYEWRIQAFPRPQRQLLYADVFSLDKRFDPSMSKKWSDTFTIENFGPARNQFVISLSIPIIFLQIYCLIWKLYLSYRTDLSDYSQGKANFLQQSVFQVDFKFHISFG